MPRADTLLPACDRHQGCCRGDAMKSSTTQRSCTRNVPSCTERSLPPKPDPPTFRATALVQRTTNCAPCYAFAPFSLQPSPIPRLLLCCTRNRSATQLTSIQISAWAALQNNPNSSLLPSSELLRMQSASTVICMTHTTAVDGVTSCPQRRAAEYHHQHIIS